MGSYVPSTADERKEMLAQAGYSSIEDMYADIPESVYLKKPLNLPEGLSEFEVRKKMSDIASENKVFGTILRGAGAYDHYIPSIVKYVTAKEEFLTSYTPYQAEISQGVLQSIFEYQTMICTLTGMDVSNASVYDGATAAAEAMGMCVKGKRKVTLVSAAAHPDVIAVMKTYAFGTGRELKIVPAKDGKTNIEALKSMLDDSVASFVLQQPNFYGIIEDADKLGEIAHAAGAKFTMSCNPMYLAIMKTPAECGADIAVGDAQPLGMAIAYGGPYLGYMAAKHELMRSLPGRIVGQTTDNAGNRVFVLTLQAREQHIRREKASSNICSNQALCALTAGVYMSTMGPCGLKTAAKQSMSKAHYLASELCKIPGVSLAYSGDYFHEFVTKMPVKAETINDALAKSGILGGLAVEDGMLWCVTEKASREKLNEAVRIVKGACA